MLFLYEESICKKEQNGISQFPWDGFIIFLSLLIALCLSIFFYDFWVYKKTSQLPWIVLKLSKMSVLPKCGDEVVLESTSEVVLMNIMLELFWGAVLKLL